VTQDEQLGAMSVRSVQQFLSGMTGSDRGVQGDPMLVGVRVRGPQPALTGLFLHGPLLLDLTDGGPVMRQVRLHGHGDQFHARPLGHVDPDLQGPAGARRVVIRDDDLVEHAGSFARS
jgi:hypothetical protein